VYVLSRKLVPIERAPYIYALGGRTIAEVSIRNPDAAVSFVKSHGQWEMRYPASYRVDAAKLAIIEKFLIEMPIKRVITQEDPSSYGLENPEITLRFKASDGSRHTLLIGNLTPSKAQRYVQDPSRSYVFLVDIGYVSQFEGSVAAYRVKDIFDVDMASLNTIRLRKGLDAVIDLVRMDGEWRISKPFSAAVNNVAMNELLVRLRGLKAIDYVEEQSPDLKKLGFEPSVYSLTLRDDQNRLQTLEFGRTEEHGYLYMRRGSGNDIIKVLASDIDFQGFEPQEILGEAPFREKIDNVQRITIDDGGATIEFIVNSAAHPPAFRYRGALVNDGDFVTFYVKCINLVAEGYDPWIPKGAPAITLTSELKDGSRKTLALFVRDAKTYYMQANGGEVRFYAAAKQVSLVRTWMKKVISSAE
jgi:hypothetical protein